jgi:hypothetical protein
LNPRIGVRVAAGQPKGYMETTVALNLVVPVTTSPEELERVIRASLPETWAVKAVAVMESKTGIGTSLNAEPIKKNDSKTVR